MDLSALTAFLAPCLPILLKAGQGVAEELTAGVGAEAAEHARRLWERLRGKIAAKPAAEEAALDVAERPDDGRALAALELQIEKLLAEDEALAAEIEQLWEAAKSAGVVAAGERSVAVGRDAGGTIVTGDSNTISG